MPSPFSYSYLVYRFLCWKGFFIVNPMLSMSTNQWLFSWLVSQSETHLPPPRSFTPPASPQLATIFTQLELVYSNGKHNSLLEIALPLMWLLHMTMLTWYIIQPYKEVIQFSKVLIFVIFFVICSSLFIIIISVLQGKAGGPGERGPPGKLVSVVYLFDISLLNFHVRALIILSTFARSITLTTVDCTDL